MAVKKLVEINPIPYLLIDVRHPDAARTEPKPFENAINIPGTFPPPINLVVFHLGEGIRIGKFGRKC